jgi:hypothetical protein
MKEKIKVLILSLVIILLILVSLKLLIPKYKLEVIRLDNSSIFLVRFDIQTGIADWTTYSPGIGNSNWVRFGGVSKDLN